MSAVVSNELSKEKARKEVELLRRIASKDKAAFAEFFEIFAIRVKSFLVRYGTEISDVNLTQNLQR